MRDTSIIRANHALYKEVREALSYALRLWLNINSIDHFLFIFFRSILRSMSPVLLTKILATGERPEHPTQRMKALYYG